MPVTSEFISSIDALTENKDYSTEAKSLDEQIQFLKMENNRLRDALRFYMELCRLEE